MSEFLAEYGGTIIVAAALVAIVALIVIRLVRNSRAGRSIGGCEHCGGCGSKEGRRSPSCGGRAAK
jgi:hypothetical protein